MYRRDDVGVIFLPANLGCDAKSPMAKKFGRTDGANELIEETS